MQGWFSAYGTVLALTEREGIDMLWTIFVILLILWALGMATSYTAGGLIHILLVIAVVVLLFRLISGRRVV
jgi:predicted ferric reductase